MELNAIELSLVALVQIGHLDGAIQLASRGFDHVIVAAPFNLKGPLLRKILHEVMNLWKHIEFVNGHDLWQLDTVGLTDPADNP